MGCSSGNFALLLCAKQLLDDLNERRRSWKLKEEALDRTVWRDRIGRGNGRVVRHYVMMMCISP